MARFFTVDRSAGFSPGVALNLRHFLVNGPHEFQKHLDELFPDGLAEFGRRGLVVPQKVQVDQTIDLVFEYVRRAHYPHRPSRYQVFFGWRTLEEAQDFRKRYPGEGFGDEVKPIYVVEADDWFVADMNLTTMGNSALGFSLYAHLYWKGEHHPTQEPAWEVLMPPPVTAVELADGGNS